MNEILSGKGIVVIGGTSGLGLAADGLYHVAGGSGRAFVDGPLHEVTAEGIHRSGFLSHNHTEHLDAKTLLPLFDSNPQAKLVVPCANRAFIIDRLGAVDSRLVEIDAGETATIGPVTLHGIPAAHNTVERDELGRCRFLGFVAQVGGFTIYHSGDTLMHEELVPALAELRPDVAFLPINGNNPERRVAGNLDGPEAARLAREIHAGMVIPHHFDMFAFNTASPEPFAAECARIDQPFQVLRNGEGCDL